MGAPQMKKKDAELLVNNLKLLRHSMKWTQEDLAHRVGVTRQTITAIENGKVIPSKTLALAILGLFTSLTLLPSVGAVVKAILNSTELDELLKKIIKGDD